MSGLGVKVLTCLYYPRASKCRCGNVNLPVFIPGLPNADVSVLTSLCSSMLVKCRYERVNRLVFFQRPSVGWVREDGRLSGCGPGLRRTSPLPGDWLSRGTILTASSGVGGQRDHLWYVSGITELACLYTCNFDRPYLIWSGNFSSRAARGVPILLLNYWLISCSIWKARNIHFDLLLMWTFRPTLPPHLVTEAIS